ncbi:C6 transcription factor, putative [Talaromyces stipitatus ATCC 10500]|uniref:C6 transcription factor, putative n=1 Tax=Talaromyces stipitatus (strain ATCC 10500 / CBS 375.48 / QM 6759 / NRRL 1006) TaxID=441959 RepID=B8MQZ9_TALSN|nr:C6 transcription factor, putative [Talaromyces stipitatus ATCC 10500]EED12834.1 C6 transcription factor, putative [Talaromyces stipitatus ATCC 10500]
MASNPLDDIRRPPHPTTRVSRACQRCRRQKLKCDEARPCTMCMRSGASCLSREVASLSRTGRRNTRRETVTPPSAPVSQESAVQNRSYKRQRFGASSSAVGFAVNIFGEYAASHSEDISTIPGLAAPSGHPKSDWTLETMSMPPGELTRSLLEAYFRHMHWFNLVFHEKTFMHSVTPLLHQSAWQEKDRGKVVISLMVAALGLQCVIHNRDWSGHALLASSSLQAIQLRDNLIAEVRVHLLNLMDECSLESVQVPLLLGTYYIFHGSPVLAWNLLGFSARAAYALSLHCESSAPLPDQFQSQIRSRTWNHVIVADTFAAMIYGRPASLDTAFSGFHDLIELDEIRLPSIVSNTIHDSNLTSITFHMLKYRLYEIIRTGLNLFRVLNLQNPITPEVFCRLVEAILQARASLESWKAELPTVFQRNAGIDERGLSLVAEYESGADDYPSYKTLILQAQTLRMTYDSAVIFINRPLLEYKVSPEHRNTIADYMPEVRKSLDLCLDAALSISRISAEDYRSEFSVSFVLMNYFSAGVILCLIPTLRPFSTAANDAKAGLLRIIRTSRKLQTQSQIAKHAEQLLTRLLKRSHEQELDNGLDVTKPSELLVANCQDTLSCASPASSPLPQSSIRNPPESQSALGFKEHSNDLTPSSSLSNSGIPFPNTDVSGRPMFSSSMRIGDHHEAMSYIPENDRYYMMDHHVDEALGFFGQMLFNLVPNDPHSAWNWGNGPY